MAVVAGVVPVAEAGDDPFLSLRDKVVEVLRITYPEAKLSRSRLPSDAYEFAESLRAFTVYRQNKVGQWQQAREELAPDSGGISVRYYVREAAYEGPAFLPVSGTADLYLFQETIVIRESKDRKWHVWARILTPRVGAAVETRRRLVRLFEEFAQYRTEGGGAG